MFTYTLLDTVHIDIIVSYTKILFYIDVPQADGVNMGWPRLVGSFKL